MIPDITMTGAPRFNLQTYRNSDSFGPVTLKGLDLPRYNREDTRTHSGQMLSDSNSMIRA